MALRFFREACVMKTENPRRPRGFTLVELLVVIAIIGILAAILIPTLYRVVIKARQSKIAQELNQLKLAVESYKQKFGDYPPDFGNITSMAELTDPSNLVVRHVRKAFPRHQENLQTAFWDATATPPQPKLDPSEALVFWLSQLWEDSRLPLTGSGKQVVLFPFDKNRLVDPDNDGFASYVPADGKDAPYVYFDSRTYAAATYPWLACPAGQPTQKTGPVLRPYKRRIRTETQTNMQYANADTFQIITAGLDGEFGVVNVNAAARPTNLVFKVFSTGEPDDTPVPDPALVEPYEISDLDNIADFSDGKIFEDFLE
jgi:prepilin-type N-terminal cleavage/methylation domain-containing protein